MPSGYPAGAKPPKAFTARQERRLAREAKREAQEARLWDMLGDSLASPTIQAGMLGALAGTLMGIPIEYAAVSFTPKREVVAGFAPGLVGDIAVQDTVHVTDSWTIRAYLWYSMLTPNVDGTIGPMGIHLPLKDTMSPVISVSVDFVYQGRASDAAINVKSYALAVDAVRGKLMALGAGAGIIGGLLVARQGRKGL